MSPKEEKDGSPHQMKMVIGMVQNSYRIVNQLLSRVEELILKIDGLHTTVHRLITSDLETTSTLEKNMSIISNLLLIQLSTSLNSSLTRPPPTPQFIYSMPAPQGVASSGGVVSGQTSSEVVTQYEAQPQPTSITEDENLRPSSLFKKLNQ